MKTSQFIPSTLSSASEYALILGTGATAAVSLAAQQATMASLPLTALVAMGLLNRHRLDQQLKGESLPTPGLDSTPAVQPETAPTNQVAAQPVPESIPVQPFPPMFAPQPKHPNSASSLPKIGAKGKSADSLTAFQQERLYEIGTYLQQTRQAKGLSLQDIHRCTFIQVYMLNAIELGQLHRLPEPFYVKAFISKYGQALGLDGRQMAAEFPL